jgi:hypothetical protein
VWRESPLVATARSQGKTPARGWLDSTAEKRPHEAAAHAEGGGVTVAVTERDLTGYVRDVARAFGWRRSHTWLSKHSPAGFPDEVLCRPPRLVFAELKSGKGRLSAEQEAWLKDLRGVPGVEVYVWRPGDMDEIAQVLR